jgi:hypothetical protein
MHESHPIDMPIMYKEKLSKVQATNKVDETLYRNIIGSIMFLSITRLDIAFVVGILSQFMHYP